MKTNILVCLMLINFGMQALQGQPPSQPMVKLPYGQVKPAGWLKQQMRENLDGFTGHLDQLVPELINDPIYASGRLHRHSMAKDLGNLKSGDAEGDEQYKWWNSETQSNWWDGFIRHALVVGTPQEVQKAADQVALMVASQDADGYLGIYAPDLRYQFTSENGELWAKTTLMRGLLAWYEATGDTLVWHALVKGVDNVMQNYPAGHSDPFRNDGQFAGGLTHGLTFTDVLHRMEQLTGNQVYGNYATFLYRNFSSHETSEDDARLPSIFNPRHKLHAHGVHTYEHIRPLAVAAAASGDEELNSALNVYMQRISAVTTPTGGAIGDEWIAGRLADATNTGYEYCSLHELLDSYATLLQTTGDIAAARCIGQIFFNAAQGSRHPSRPAIAYLKTDNSFEMTGTLNGHPEPGRDQTRYKYSPAHQDVAVCCNPNAGRIAPAFLQSCWLKQGDNTLVAAIPVAVSLQTTMGSAQVKIASITNFPYDNKVTFNIQSPEGVAMKLKIGIPERSTVTRCSQPYAEEAGFILIDRFFSRNDSITVEFDFQVAVLSEASGKKYFARGPLVYALPVEATESEGRNYGPGFSDWYYTPLHQKNYGYLPQHDARFEGGKLEATLMNLETHVPVRVKLVPIGQTLLRQAAF